MSEQTMPLSLVARDLGEIIEEVGAGGAAVRVTRRGQVRAVLISEAEYEGLTRAKRELAVLRENDRGRYLAEGGTT